MRERLKKLIRSGVSQSQQKCKDYGCYDYGDVADYLLENGVIVPPCKVGDDLWYIDENNEVNVQKNGIRKIVYCGDGKFGVLDKDGYYDDIGTKYAYLSREEAEKALKGCEK